MPFCWRYVIASISFVVAKADSFDKLQGIPEGGEKGQALIKKSDESFDAEWAKIEALPEGGAEGQVLTKKSSADGDAEWKNAVQSDWCEIDESSPSYIKNKLGGYYEADFESKAFNPVYLLVPPNNLIELKFDSTPHYEDVYYLSIDYDESAPFNGNLKQTCFVTFKTLTDEDNALSFYVLDRGKTCPVYEKRGKIRSIQGYEVNAIPIGHAFIPPATGNNFGGVKSSRIVSNVDDNIWESGAIDQDGHLLQKKSVQVIESLTSDNVDSLFASAGEAFIIGGSPYLEEKIGLISSDFPVFATTTKIDYSSGRPCFVYLFFTKTNKSGEFILTTGGDVSSYSIAISESNLFLVHLIQGEPDADDNPTYTVDKTFTEIKTACDAGKKVELIPPAGNPQFIRGVGSAPFEVVNVTTKAIDFQSLGASLIGISDLPAWILGGVPLGIIGVSISSDEKVSVEFPLSVDGDTGMPVWHAVQKLPQQYVVAVTAGTDGTLSANSTLAQLQIVMQAYSHAGGIIGSASINATYNRKLYYMSAATGASVTFSATTENGLETLTVSNDGKEGSTDVWTHEVTPFGNKVVVTLAYQNGKYTPSISARAIDSAAQAGKNVVLKNPDSGCEIPLIYSSSYDIGLATFTYAHDVGRCECCVEFGRIAGMRR